MRCERVLALYDEYARGDLPIGTASRVDEHLAACPDCRQRYELDDAVATLVRQHTAVAHPGPRYFDDLQRRVLAELDRRRGDVEPSIDAAGVQGRWPGRPLWWAGAAAAAALALVGALPTAPPSTLHTLARHTERPTPAAPQLAAGNEEPRPAPAQPRVTPIDLSRVIAALAGLAPSTGSQAASLPAIEKGLAAADAPSAGGDPRRAVNATERRPPVDSDRLRLASRLPRFEAAMPADIDQQIQHIRAELAAGGGEERLLDQLQRLLQLVEQSGDARPQLSALPWVRQAGLYLKADEALAAGDPTAASTYYRNILLIDEQTMPIPERPSPLAVRAALQLADLAYGEWADFQTAREYYLRCSDPRAAAALTPVERDNVASQLNRLEQFAANHWEVLHLLHLVRREAWPQAITAFRRLLENAAAAPLRPEASRAMIDRLATSPAPAEAVSDVYQALARAAEHETNEDIRAWLELSLGDLALRHFKNPKQAIDRYRRVVAIGGTGRAADTARAKLDELIERQLSDLVR